MQWAAERNGQLSAAHYITKLIAVYAEVYSDIRFLERKVSAIYLISYKISFGISEDYEKHGFIF